MKRDRPHKLFTDVKGNRAIHSILTSGNGNSLDMRQLSCHCSNCIDGNYDVCEDKEYVDEWESIEVGQERGYGQQRATRADIEEKREGIKDLVSEGAVIAIASGNPGGEYYLMKVTGNGPRGS